MVLEYRWDDRSIGVERFDSATVRGGAAVAVVWIPCEDISADAVTTGLSIVDEDQRCYRLRFLSITCLSGCSLVIGRVQPID